jgi:hypothetical protein
MTKLGQFFQELQVRELSINGHWYVHAVGIMTVRLSVVCSTFR